MSDHLRSIFLQEFGKTSIPSEYLEDIYNITRTWLFSDISHLDAVTAVIRAFELGESKCD